MKISFTSLLPALTKLGRYFQDGMEHYSAAQRMGASLDAPQLASYIFTRMEGWDPKVKGIKIIDPDTAKAASRFISGVVINIAKGK